MKYKHLGSASGAWLFSSSPDDVLRMGGVPGLGGLGFRAGLVGGADCL